MPIVLATYAQSTEDKTLLIFEGSEAGNLSSITFTEIPEKEIVLNEGDVIPTPFEVKAQTTCTAEEADTGYGNENAQQYYAGSYAEFVSALQLVQDGDVINLTHYVAIKPDNTFPNNLGVWEPFVVDKAITIDGGALQNKLSFERGLPLELRADITFKNMNLTMIPEGGVNASFIYVSDTKVIFDNVSTTVEELIAGVPDPRPTIVAGTYGTHASMGEQAHIIIRNATYESAFAAIMAGNQNTLKTTNTIIDIESEDLVVKEGIKLFGLNNTMMPGKTIINTSSKRISSYEGLEIGGESTLNFKNVSVIPEVTVLNIDNVQLIGSASKVKFSTYTEGINSAIINAGAELTFASKTVNNFTLEVLGGSGTLVIPQYSTLTLGSVRNRPTIKVWEWLYYKENILGFVVLGNEQPGDIIYYVNGEKYIRQDDQLVLFDGADLPLNELNDALVQYLGETVVMSGNDQVITRCWRASDYCGNEAFFEQTITILSAVTSGVEDVQDLSFFLYPNPASKEFSFNHPEGVCSVKIYDINGRLVQYFPQKSSYQIYGLPKGLYFIIVEHADGRSRFKLKKE
ncbi:MAG: T9SS type A sorting domain-containing protein [Bacteroidales bacterium]|nr:T9SS type A sorting domain-containing protein [Bacteroidales bacterium]